MNRYLFKLYVTGQTAKSQVVVANLQRICEKWYPGRYQVTIVDILERPDEAERDHIMATPTLVKLYPPPVQRIIGDLSDTEKVRVSLGLPVA